MGNCEKCNTKLNSKENQLCTRCSQLKNNDDTGPCVVNELLMYCDNHRHGSTTDNLVKVLCAFYDEYEVKNARDVLWKSLKDKNCIEEFIDRRDSAKKPKVVAICEDIIKAMRQVDDAGVAVKYYAADWKRIPKSSPESSTDLAVATRLAELEEKIEFMSNNFSKLRGDHEMVADRVSGVENRIQQGANAGTSTDAREETEVPTPPISESADDITSGDESDKNAASNQDGEFIRPAAHIRKEQRRFHRGNHGNRTNSGPPSYAGAAARGHMGPNQNPKGNRTGSGVIGNAQNTGLRAGPLPNRDFFVSRVHKEDGMEKIRRFLLGRKIDLRNIKQTSHPSSMCNSFRITVSLKDAEIVTKSDFWETGIRIRKWQERNDEGAESSAY